MRMASCTLRCRRSRSPPSRCRTPRACSGRPMPARVPPPHPPQPPQPRASRRRTATACPTAPRSLRAPSSTRAQTVACFPSCAPRATAACQLRSTSQPSSTSQQSASCATARHLLPRARRRASVHGTAAGDVRTRAADRRQHPRRRVRPRRPAHHAAPLQLRRPHGIRKPLIRRRSKRVAAPSPRLPPGEYCMRPRARNARTRATRTPRGAPPARLCRAPAPLPSLRGPVFNACSCAPLTCAFRPPAPAPRPESVAPAHALAVVARSPSVC